MTLSKLKSSFAKTAAVAAVAGGLAGCSTTEVADTIELGLNVANAVNVAQGGQSVMTNCYDAYGNYVYTVYGFTC